MQGRSIERLKRDGHYLGPHSTHTCSMPTGTIRNKTLVTREQFKRDLNENFAAMRPFGIDARPAHYFLPPYEWYNREIADWSTELGITHRKFHARHPLERRLHDRPKTKTTSQATR